MGLLSWLFPSDADRMNKAEKLLSEQAWAQARDELMGLEGERASELRHAAREGLKTRNIELALTCADAGQLQEAKDHLELAAEFATKGDPDLRAARRQLREGRKPSPQSAPAPSLGGGGGGVLGSMGIQVATPASLAGNAALGGSEGDDPIFSLPPDDPRVRFAIKVEQYEPEQSERMRALGPSFASAVMAMEESPIRAFVELQSFTEREPLARWFRAQSAMAVGKPQVAVEELQAMAQEMGGHQLLAGQHSAAVLAGALMQSGQSEQALQVLERALAKSPGVLSLRVNRALVLEALGRDEQADELARSIVQQSSRVMEMYKLMARCRVRAGKRVAAMQALEAGLVTNCSSGKCGSLPFDLQAGRELARLYLEDRIEPNRAAELIGRVRKNAPQPNWMDAYLEALGHRNGGGGELGKRVQALSANLKPGDPRHEMLHASFAKQLT